MSTDIIISEKDYCRLNNLLQEASEDYSEDLEIELDRAKIVSDEDVPPYVITMNTKFKYLDKNYNQEKVITLVYPKRADLSKGYISVLAPIGSAIIGLSVGQEINWMFPDKKTRTMKILEILYQPEANGDWHL